MKKVFITGASRGIGKAVSDLFFERGCEVMSPQRKDLDLSSPESVSEFIKKFDGKADILINNAGINPLLSLEEISYHALLEVFNTNLFSAIMLAQAVSAHMKKNKFGRIVNISSVWSFDFDY